MWASKKVSVRKADEICISSSHTIRTKKDHLNIAMNDEE